MHLNLFLSRAGIASRRKAVELIKKGLITINDRVETNPAYQVKPGDKVRYGEQRIKPSGEYVYILLNKPKGYITTTANEKERKTIMELLPRIPKGRLYPVGRLDKDSTGALLCTNDGELAHRLTHPRYKIPKTYEALLDTECSELDLAQLTEGIYLSDGFIKPDYIGYTGKSKRRLKIVLHSGRNRIVRRMIEKFDYKVKELTRTKFGPLSIKGIKPGRWQKLTAQEVQELKQLTQSSLKNRKKH